MNTTPVLKKKRRIPLLLVIILIIFSQKTECTKRSPEEDILPSAPVQKYRRVHFDLAGPSDEADSSSSAIEEGPFTRATSPANFKYMLLENENASPLISFLGTLTGVDLTSVKLSPGDLTASKENEEEIFFEFTGQDSKERNFLINLQIQDQPSSYARPPYFAARHYSQQEGKWQGPQPIIALNIINYNASLGPHPHFKHELQFYEKDILVPLQENKPEETLESPPYLHIIQYTLPQINLQDISNILLKQWLQLLKEAERLPAIPARTKTPVRQAYERLKILKEIRLEINKKIKISYDQGFISGKKEAALAIASKMLTESFGIEKICDLTGLSPQEVEALQASMTS